jgi:phosphotransferase system HPr (HPr) family protein
MAHADVVFLDRYGLHPRAAMRISTAAAAFASSIRIEPLSGGGSPIDAESMLALVSSGIRHGDRVRVSADGADESDAVRALADLIAAGACHP